MLRKNKKVSFIFHLIILMAAESSFITQTAFSADQSLEKKGQELFSSKACLGCHSFGGGALSGPDLKGVFERRDLNWVKSWLSNPDAMIDKKDPIAMEMLKKYAVRMPNLGLTPEEIDALIAFVAKSGGGTPTASKTGVTQPTEASKTTPEGAPLAQTQIEGPSKPSYWKRLTAWIGSWFGSTDSASSMSLEDIAKERGLSPEDILSAVKTYTPTGKHDPYLMFASGGHNGGVLVIGVPSMRIIKTIPVFSPDSWHGYGVGSKDYDRLLAESSKNSAAKLTWGDVHHPALSETGGMYDGQFLFVNDKANARIAVISLKDFTTKQIVKNPLFVNDHGGAFVTPNTEYIIETSQYNVPLPNRPEPLSKYAEKYRGAATFWKFDRVRGRIDHSKSFAIELPAYWQDLTDAGKGVSDGYCFFNSLNTEQGTGGNLQGNPNFEISASKNDMDFLHVLNWRKAEALVNANKFKMIEGVKVVTLETAISEGILHFVHEPKSPHGVDVSPNGNYIVVSGKLDPHTTVYSFEKIKKAIDDKNYDGKDAYGVPILKYDAVLEAQLEVGLGPLHTQFDANGYAYTSLFLDSAIAKWTLGEPYHKGDKAWKLVDTVPVQYNIGHLSCIEGDTVDPGKGYCVALNKWAIDRYNNVGPLLPQNFQLVDTSGEKMKVIYDLPIPNAEPHYVQIVKASRLSPIEVYPMGTDPSTMEKSEHFTPGGKERVIRNGNNVTVYMTLIRSHITPDRIEVKKGDRVTIHISSIEAAKDATHGFAISDHNINLSIEPGKVETVEFNANKSGVFPFYCTEFCSALHLEMTGYLIVN